MGLHVGGFIVWRGVLVAREPASRSVDKTSLSASRNADRLRNGLLRSVGARCLRVACPGPVAAHGCRSLVQVLWLAYGSARQAARSSETAIAFAGAGRASTETVVAFVGAKWAFLVHFSVAVVLPVSMVAVWGRAVVPAVSCWPAPVAAEVLLVSTAPRCRASCAKKFALLGLMGSSPVEWCNRFVSFGVGYALSWSGGSSCPVGWGVSRDLVRMSRLR